MTISDYLESRFPLILDDEGPEEDCGYEIVDGEWVPTGGDESETVQVD